MAGSSGITKGDVSAAELQDIKARAQREDIRTTWGEASAEAFDIFGLAPQKMIGFSGITKGDVSKGDVSAAELQDIEVRAQREDIRTSWGEASAEAFDNCGLTPPASRYVVFSLPNEFVTIYSSIYGDSYRLPALGLKPYVNPQDVDNYKQDVVKCNDLRRSRD
jgi:hypothetical protein